VTGRRRATTRLRHGCARWWPSVAAEEEAVAVVAVEEAEAERLAAPRKSGRTDQRRNDRPTR
jgi:hypothetical protein